VLKNSERSSAAIDHPLTGFSHSANLTNDHARIESMDRNGATLNHPTACPSRRTGTLASIEAHDPKSAPVSRPSDTLRISVVTPSLNQGRFIERTILSVLQQDERDVEYFVVDGGSSDETVAILRRYEGDLRWVSEPDRGQSHAINKGIAATSGEIIGWLNSDDVYEPGCLRTVREHFRSRCDVDVVYGDAWILDEEGRRLGTYPSEPWDVRRLRDACFLCQPAVFFRRRVVQQCGAIDETLHYSMDYEFWLRLASFGIRFAYLPTILAGSRLHASCKTRRHRARVHAEINDMLWRTLGVVPSRWLLNYSAALCDVNTPAGLRPIVLSMTLLPLAVLASLRWNGMLRWRDLREWAVVLWEKAMKLLRPSDTTIRPLAER
jgi:glycosyltransferase involved in cell wall biosynthesis